MSECHCGCQIVIFLSAWDPPAFLWTACRGMPNEAIERRQAALEHARRSFYYPAAPGMQTSAAADIIFSNLIRYGQRLKAQEFVP